MRSAQIILLSLVFGLLALAQAQAQVPESKPIIVITQKPVDPTAYSWLDPNAVKALKSDVDQIKAGSIKDFVMAAAPGKAWTTRFIDEKGSLVSIEELARQTVEECEYFNSGAPCFIVSINGEDGREANGVLPLQPRLLSGIPKKYDSGRVPFLTIDGKHQLASYARSASPKALIVSIHGWWQWNSGSTTLDAIDKDQTSCQKHLAGDKDDVCLLYAVDDMVVFNPQDQ
jgi:hypothetical protein